MKRRNCSLCCYLLHMSVLSKVSARQSTRAYVFLTLNIQVVLTGTVRSCFSFPLAESVSLVFTPVFAFCFTLVRNKRSDAIVFFHSKAPPILPVSPDQRNIFLNKRSLWKTFDHNLTQTCPPHRYPPAVVESEWAAEAPGFCALLA